MTIRAPLYTRIVVRPQRPELQPENLLTGTLRGQDKFYGLGGPDYDYPNPIPKAFSMALRTWTQSTPLQLVGKDVVYGAPGQVPDYDWPNPLRARPVRVDLIPNTLPLNAVPSPFAQSDWPNPLRARQWFAGPQGTPLANVSSGIQPFGQANWPNPLQTAWRRQDDALNLLQGTLGQAMPFSLASWPRPLQAPWKRLDDAPNVLVGMPAAGTPFGAYDWPSPQIRVPIYQEVGLTAFALYNTTDVPVVTPTGVGEYPKKKKRRVILDGKILLLTDAQILDLLQQQPEPPKAKQAKKLAKKQAKAEKAEKQEPTYTAAPNFDPWWDYFIQSRQAEIAGLIRAEAIRMQDEEDEAIAWMLLND